MALGHMAAHAAQPPTPQHPAKIQNSSPPNAWQAAMM